MPRKLVRCLVHFGLLVLTAGGFLEVRAQHPDLKPWPDAKSADSSVCQQCHAAKSTGTTVHAAVQMGCDSCHAVTRYGKETDILQTAEGNDLCFTCHEDKRPQPKQLSVHAPVRREKCTTCHEPHSSPNAHLLRQPTASPEPTQNLCLICHKDIAAQIQKAIKHPAVDMGCETCHATHKSGPAGQPEDTFHLVSPQPGLCLTCHDASDAGLKKAHRNQPFGGSRCTECHNPHGSERPKLINNFVHAAFEGDSCSTCHAESKPGQETVALAEGARRDLCLSCHSDIQETSTQAKTKHLGLETSSGCVACHSPHAATYPHQLRRGPVKTCLGCHRSLAEAGATKKFLHRPAFELGCATCHQPHGGERKRFLRAEGNDLCLTCHDIGVLGTMQVQERRHEPVHLFGGSVSVDPGFLKDIKAIQLDGAREKGHPILARHPVRGDYPIAKNLTCLTCHQSHAANGSKRLFVQDAADGQALCQSCH